MGSEFDGTVIGVNGKRYPAGSEQLDDPDDGVGIVRAKGQKIQGAVPTVDADGEVTWVVPSGGSGVEVPEFPEIPEILSGQMARATLATNPTITNGAFDGSPAARPSFGNVSGTGFSGSVNWASIENGKVRLSGGTYLIRFNHGGTWEQAPADAKTYINIDSAGFNERLSPDTSYGVGQYERLSQIALFIVSFTADTLLTPVFSLESETPAGSGFVNGDWTIVKLG